MVMFTGSVELKFKSSPSISKKNSERLMVMFVFSDQLMRGIGFKREGASFTGVMFKVTLLLSTVKSAGSYAVNITVLIPVKFAGGVKVTMPVLLLIDTVMFNGVVALKFKSSLSESLKCCVRFKLVFTVSSGQLRLRMVVINVGAVLLMMISSMAVIFSVPEQFTLNQ